MKDEAEQILRRHIEASCRFRGPEQLSGHPALLRQGRVRAQNLNLMLDVGEHGEMIGVDEDVPAVLEGGKEVKRLFMGVRNGFRWLKRT